MYVVHPAGVHWAQVALLAEKGVVLYDPVETGQEEIIAVVTEMGFGAELVSDTESHNQIKLEVRGRWIFNPSCI